MKILATLSLVASLACIAVLAVVLGDNAVLRGRVASLEAKNHRETGSSAPPDLEAIADAVTPLVLARAPAPAPAPAPAQPAETPGAMPVASATDVEQLTLRLDAAEERLVGAEGSLRAARDQLLGGRLVTGETVDEFLDRRIAEHMLGGGRDRPGEQGGGGSEPKERSFDDLAQALALDEVQREEVRGVLVDSKRAAYDVLNTPRLDGGKFMDDFADLYTGGVENPDRAAEQIFLRALREPIPGTDETFGSAIIGVQAHATEAIRKNLREDQTTVFDGLAFDLLEIQTSTDPMRDHVMERMGLQPPPAEER